MNDLEERARRAEKTLENFLNLKKEVSTVKRSISQANTLNLTMLNTHNFDNCANLEFSNSLEFDKDFNKNEE